MLKLSSGLAFVEFTEHSLAMYAIKYLNNLQLSANRGLIVDFALEDARKMFKRKMKLEKFAKIADDKRKEARNLRREEKRKNEAANQTIELGQTKAPIQPQRPSVKECEDLATLQTMLEATHSRGKK